jgi:hypothetical protein
VQKRWGVWKRSNPSQDIGGKESAPYHNSPLLSFLRSPAATLPCCCLRATRGRGRESRRPFLSFPPPTLSLLSFSIQDRSQPSHTRRTFHCTQIRSEQEREREREGGSTRPRLGAPVSYCFPFHVDHGYLPALPLSQDSFFLPMCCYVCYFFRRIWGPLVLGFCSALLCSVPLIPRNRRLPSVHGS